MIDESIRELVNRCEEELKEEFKYINELCNHNSELVLNAFKNNKKIRQVRIKSVYLKKIGAKAFYNCKKLKKVYIYSLVSLRYGKKAFYKKGNSKMTIIYSSECIKNMKLRLKKAKCKGYRYTIKKLM